MHSLVRTHMHSATLQVPARMLGGYINHSAAFAVPHPGVHVCVRGAAGVLLRGYAHARLGHADVTRTGHQPSSQLAHSAVTCSCTHT